jgi:hypothetical protein
MATTINRAGRILDQLNNEFVAKLEQLTHLEDRVPDPPETPVGACIGIIWIASFEGCDSNIFDRMQSRIDCMTSTCWDPKRSQCRLHILGTSKGDQLAAFAAASHART